MTYLNSCERVGALNNLEAVLNEYQSARSPQPVRAVHQDRGRGVHGERRSLVDPSRVELEYEVQKVITPKIDTITVLGMYAVW